MQLCRCIFLPYYLCKILVVKHLPCQRKLHEFYHVGCLFCKSPITKLLSNNTVPFTVMWSHLWRLILSQEFLGIPKAVDLMEHVKTCTNWWTWSTDFPQSSFILGFTETVLKKSQETHFYMQNMTFFKMWSSVFNIVQYWTLLLQR